jgi:hypothetical protein
MQLLNVCSRKIYDKNGEKKIKWYKVGLLKITDTGKKYMQLFHLPDTEYFIFERDETTPEVKIEE